MAMPATRRVNDSGRLQEYSQGFAEDKEYMSVSTVISSVSISFSQKSIWRQHTKKRFATLVPIVYDPTFLPVH